MARKYWYVSPRGSQWRVHSEGVADSLFDAKASAITAATSAAKAFHDSTGKPTGVRIQRVDGTFEDERSYGNDPFPPPG